MRGLAGWIMRGRTQAIIATVLSASLALLLTVPDVGSARLALGMAASVLVAISAASVGLVTLRRGIGEGANLMMWGMIPALIWLVWKDDASPMVIIIGTAVMSAVLRQWVSWSRTLGFGTAVGLLGSLTVTWLAPGAVTEVGEIAGKMAASLAERQPDAAEVLGVDVLRELLLGGLVASHLGWILASLAIARWWQARLYNPGGFRAEFHQLRLAPLFAGVLIATLVLGNGLVEGMFRWLPVLMLPFILAGLALVHGVVAKRELGRSWLIAFYSAAFVAGPYLISLLVLLAVIDSFLNIRKRIPARS